MMQSQSLGGIKSVKNPSKLTQSANSPVPTGVLNHNVMVLIDATYCAGGGEGLEHAVSPPPVAVLEGLDNL